LQCFESASWSIHTSVGAEVGGGVSSWSGVLVVSLVLVVLREERKLISFFFLPDSFFKVPNLFLLHCISRTVRKGLKLVESKIPQDNFFYHGGKYILSEFEKCS
jgi:hypothetical protein